jgi:ketosteroid isomerase-like protein
MKRVRSIPLYVAVFVFCTALSLAQGGQGLPPTDELYKTIAGLDTKLFDAYNRCDLNKLGSLVTEDLEFYHDQTGLAVGRQNLVDAVKQNICGKVHRELVPGTLEVYPLKGYGAVEIGVHRFTHPDDASNVGEAKFTMIWQLKDGVWKISRVISFDHHPAAK